MTTKKVLGPDPMSDRQQGDLVGRIKAGVESGKFSWAEVAVAMFRTEAAVRKWAKEGHVPFGHQERLRRFLDLAGV